MTVTWRMAVIGLAMLMLQPAVAMAQGAVFSLAELLQTRRLEVGDSVIVMDINRRRMKADVTRLSSDSLIVVNGRMEREFSEAEILKIDRQDSLLNGVLIGLMSAGLVARSVDLSSDYASATAGGVILFAGGGLLIGAIVDMSIHETVYEGPGWRWTFEPLLTKGGAGARLSAGW